MSDNGPRYDWSAVAAAEILNLHFDGNEPKAVLFRRILFTILNAMNKAEEEINGKGRSHRRIEQKSLSALYYHGRCGLRYKYE